MGFLRVIPHTLPCNLSNYYSIVTEDDLDRVWSSVENSIKVMMEGEESED